MSVSQVIPPGVVLGNDFEILRPIGQGGMGTVYQAIQRTTGAPRAVKVMRASLASDPRFRARFDLEARVSARIPSDHVVHVVSAGVDEVTHAPWIAMELLEGETLGAYLERQGRLSLPDARLVLGQLFHAVATAHEAGVVHRDIKPDNVFLARARVVGVPFMVKVLDFGVAKILAEARAATVAVGTPAYMAPEQTAMAGEIGPQADVWALGLLVFRALAGTSYWKAESTPEAGAVHLWREILVEALVPATERARALRAPGALPADFDRWFARCVARDIEGRFENAAAAFAELSPLLDAQPAARGPSDAPTVGVSGVGADGGGVVVTLNAGAPTALGPMPTDPGERRSGTARVTYREKNERVIVEGARGATLLEVSLGNGVSHHHACNGRARCTTCRIVVLDGAAALGPRTDAEEKVARARSWPPAIRLACQARVLGDVTVRRLVVDDEDLATVNASVSGEEPSVESGVALSLVLPGFEDFARENFAHDVVHVLNRYLRQICDPAIANGGAIVRYEPAGVSFLFGEGVPSQEALQQAARSALRAQARVKQLNAYVLRHFGCQFELCAGIHSGTILRAAVGHPSRSEQLVFGDGITGALDAARGAAEQGAPIVATGAALRLSPGLLRTGRTIELRAGAKALEVLDFDRPDVVLLVQSTFERLEGRTAQFSERFYAKLFETAPAVAPLFEHTDMAAQREMLMDVLSMAIRSLDRLTELLPTLRELGARHVAYGAKPSHYKVVGRVLLETLEEFLGTEFSPEVHLAWYEIYGTLAREMIEGTRAVAVNA